MRALLLAGSESKRMWPLVDTCPKPLLDIGGKPVIQWIIEDMRAAGIRDIVVSVGYRGDQIQEFLGRGHSFGVKIEYAVQKEHQSVADSILVAKEELQGEDAFFIVNADILGEPTMFRRAQRHFKDLGAEAVVSLTLTNTPQFYGIAVIDERARIKQLIEKPQPSEIQSRYAVAGIYVVQSTIFDLLEKTKDLTSTFQQLIDKGKEVFGSVWERDWVEISYPWDLIRGNRFVLDKVLTGKGSFIAASADVQQPSRIEGSVHISEGVVIRPHSTIRGPTYIGPDTYIGNNALVREYTALGSNVIVGFGVEIKESLIYNDTKIGRLCFVGDSVVGQNVDIGAGAQLVNIPVAGESISSNIQGHPEVVPRQKYGAVIGDNAILSPNVSVHPGVKIGPNSIVLPGTILSEDVPANTEAKTTHKVAFRELGPRKEKKT
ncbi:MAG: bifunctional sugar-1-phosphate nucleotidylyltransferase/acetyltransferase [Candidatus Hermodarchaeia archaeon]|jgi:bifunctional UDP-N-acetylglucosamine pyrophosphorylase/glucosamine-1-phosphate N-acetyltransferase